MRHFRRLRWISITVFVCCGGRSATLADAKPPDKATAKNPLSIRIDLRKQPNAQTIDIEEPVRVVLTNHSDKPIRIWSEHARNGYYQLSFRFTNRRTGKVLAAKRQTVDETTWTWREDAVFPDPDVIEIGAKQQLAVFARLDGIGGNQRTWKGVPGPNSDDQYSVVAFFESTFPAKRNSPAVWKGRIQSVRKVVKVIAPGLETPHDYLWSRFPDRALGPHFPDRN